ncbi:MAG: class I SAM-dependent methyltransferase, partial [Acidobacteriota bacterium]|nr:class I SAM-dependent methyltransferase [Acidobacteriota bacterium]
MKAGAYPFVLPVMTARALRREGLLRIFDPRRFYFGWRGQEIDLLFQRIGAGRINGARILLQGVGRAQEFGFLRSYKPLQIVGTDFRPEWDGATAEVDKGGTFRLVAGDLARLPFRTGLFDGAASINTFEHLRELDAALEETARVLRPGGWFMA